MPTALSVIEKTAVRYPNDPAITVGDETRSYRDLMEDVERTASSLSAAGVGVESRVGLLFKNGLDFMPTVLACWELGACAIPLNFRLTDAEMLQCVRISECEYLIASEQCKESAQKLENALPSKELRIYLFEDLLELDSEAFERGFENVSSLDYAEALNIFTGGTTGGFKAAVIPHRSLLLYIMNSLAVPGLYSKEDVFLNYAPMFHVGGLGQVIGMLCVGAHVILTNSCHPEELFELMVRHRVSQLLLIPPTIIRRFADCMHRASLETLPHVRLVQMAGGSAGKDVVRDVFDVFPNALVEIGYGMSELAVSMTNVFSKAEFEARPEIAESVGCPLTGDEVKIVNEDGVTVETGEVGELMGRSLTAFSGYRTVETVGTGWLITPLDENGWYATGDMMRCDDLGMFYFSSRKKEMLKSGGENVYASEVERVIADFPLGSIAECSVVGVKHPVFDEIVVAALMVKPGFELSVDELRAHCRTKLAAYKCPKRFFLLEDFPRSDVGKVVKSQLIPLLEQKLREEPLNE